MYWKHPAFLTITEQNAVELGKVRLVADLLKNTDKLDSEIIVRTMGHRDLKDL